MKKIYSILAILILTATVMNGQEISQADNSLIDKLYISKMVVTKEKITSGELGKVFSGNFYNVNTRFAITDDESIFGCTKRIMIVNNGKIFEMASYATNIESFLKNTFSLKTEADAVVFEAAIDAIDPLSEWDQDKKEHLKKDNKWYFVRGTGFGYKQAYIVTLDQSSKITDIDYSREAIKTE